MLTDEELLERLRTKYGTAHIGGIEDDEGRRFVRIYGLRVAYRDAYNDVAGKGVYEQSIMDQEQ
jgi:hypothetical protein